MEGNNHQEDYSGRRWERLGAEYNLSWYRPERIAVDQNPKPGKYRVSLKTYLIIHVFGDMNDSFILCLCLALERKSK